MIQVKVCRTKTDFKQCSPVILALGGARKIRKKFKVFLSYILSLRQKLMIKFTRMSLILKEVLKSFVQIATV